MWDLGLLPEIEPVPPALESQSLKPLNSQGSPLFAPLTLKTTLWDKFCFSPYFTDKKTETKRLSNWPTASQLGSGRTGIIIQEMWLQAPGGADPMGTKLQHL